MNRFINCIAHKSSDGQLLLGDEKTALFDCGMMFCAEKTIQNVKNALKTRPAGKQSCLQALDYIFLTHTHYDHIGALPFFRKEWSANGGSNLNVVTCETGADVLLKDTPRRVIRELSLAAAKSYSTNLDMEYSDDLFHADITVKENDIISLGGISVQIIETPGHTRDSLSFYIPELKLLIISETPGVLMPDGSIYPCYLTSYNDTLSSIKKCREIPYEYLSLPHCGIADRDKADGFFEKALKINAACRDFILDMKSKNFTEDEMLNSYFTKYASETLLTYQPKDAFLANAKATINCTLKEGD